MAELKTKATDANVAAFLATIKDRKRQQDVRSVIAVMKEATSQPPRMWGASIVGFGSFTYKYESGRQGEWFIAGLSPRKANLTLYILPGLHEHEADLGKLGTFTTGKSCLYVKNVDDIRLPVLKRMVKRAAKRLAGGLDRTTTDRRR